MSLRRRDIPVFVVSRGRAGMMAKKYTHSYLCEMGVPHRVVVEPHEVDAYRSNVQDSSLCEVVVMDMSYKESYETCDDGDHIRTGPGPARNFAMDLSVSEGAPAHWVLDDNIKRIPLYTISNRQPKCGDDRGFRAIERMMLEMFSNVGMGGPNYEMFVVRRQKQKALTLNTRIFSCNLIRNDAGIRWRGRYNEDVIISLDMMRAGWCTILTNTFLQVKRNTQRFPGGNTEVFYDHEGTGRKSLLLKQVYPQYVDLMHRYGRNHHWIDMRKHFRHLKLLRRDNHPR